MSEPHDALRRRDARAIWHPFAQMQGFWDDAPPVIVGAEGNELVDADGRRYLDGVSSLWCNVHGHRVPELDAALRAQLDRVAHSTLLGLGSEASIECAEALLAVAPAGLTRVFFSDSGSTAVEVALKLAFQYWRQNGRPERRTFATLGEGYHGDTIGSVSLGGSALFHGIFEPLLFPKLTLPTPYGYRAPDGHTPESWGEHCAREAERLVAAHAHELAAVVLEPLVQGAAGMIVQPRGYLSRVAAACRAHDVLLVLDEVATGFGRTGTMFACEQEGVRPDLLCVAKGLTGGYLPLAATLTTERLHDGFLGDFSSQRTFFHGHTYTGNALGCAVATASLGLFRSRDVLGRLPAKLSRMAGWLERIAALPHVGEVRRVGAMVGIELVKDRGSKEPYGYGERIGHRVIVRAREDGVLLRPLGPVVVWMPPLSITLEELDRLGDATLRAIRAVTEAA